MIPDAGAVEDANGTIHPMAERRYSVHPGTINVGTTINQTETTKAGRVKSRVSYINPSDNLLLWIIWASREFWLLDSDICDARAKDILIHLREYDQRLTNLIYVVTVYDKDLEIVGAEYPFLLAVAAFSRYKIAVYYTSMPVPAITTGDSAVAMTSTVTAHPLAFVERLCVGGRARLTAESRNESTYG